MNPGFPPPGMFFPPNMPNMPNMPPMPMMSVPGQFPMPPMAGLMHGIPVGMPPQIPGTMGITVPTGVASISAPPVRNIIAPLKPQIQMPKPIPMIPPRITVKPSGPPVPVFVGNITERASDQLIRQLFAKCGQVAHWKRVQGANGKWQAFGYCDYVFEESALRAVRLLHDLQVGDKKLVVKVNPKYLKEKNKEEKSSQDDNKSEKEGEDKKESEDDTKGDAVKNGNGEQAGESNGESQNGTSEAKTALDEDTMNEDNQVMEEIQRLLADSRFDLKLAKVEPTKEQDSPKMDGPKDNFADMDIDNEKKNLIHREIGKFRDSHKKQDEEKERREREREQRKELDRNRDDRDHRSDRDRDRDRSSYRDTGRDNGRDSGRDSGRERDRERDRERERERERQRERERDRERDRDRRERRGNSRSPGRDRRRVDRYERDSRDSRDVREEVEDESIFERRQMERELRKKEQSYQERLKNWESREIRKQKEREKERLKQEQKRKAESKEMEHLKQFFEDYNDEVDDVKNYKAGAMQRKLRDREKEKEEDERDRKQEKRELEELRKKLAEDNANVVQEKDLHLNQEEAPDSEPMDCTDTEPVSVPESFASESNSLPAIVNGLRNDFNGAIEPGRPKRNDEIHVKAFSLSKNFATSAGLLPQVAGSGIQTEVTPSTDSQNASQLIRKSKQSIQEVFNTADDEENELATKRRRLPLLDENTDSNQSSQSNQLRSNSMSAEEKRTRTKALIDSIPTSKEELFKYAIDWSVIDSNLMEKRIRPWINKKITEYIGEEEEALLDFICTKLNAKCNASSILKDVAMVLDEEAEVFVMKMWRLIIYEIEMKKKGLYIK